MAVDVSQVEKYCHQNTETMSPIDRAGEPDASSFGICIDTHSWIEDRFVNGFHGSSVVQAFCSCLVQLVDMHVMARNSIIQ